MPNIASKITIINRAALWVSEGFIQDLADDSPIARWMNSFYAINKASFLESYDWPEALRDRTLALLKEEGQFGYEFAYQAPTDYLRAFKVGSNPQDYKFADNKIFSNSNPLRLWYLANIGVEDFTASMAEALSAKLALDYSISKNRTGSAVDAMHTRMNEVMADAQNSASRQNNPPTQNRRPNMFNARVVGGVVVRSGNN